MVHLRHPNHSKGWELVEQKNASLFNDVEYEK